MILLLLFGLAMCPPALWVACVIILTGEIYQKNKEEDGFLRVWPGGNKIAVVILILIQLLALLVKLMDTRAVTR